MLNNKNDITKTNAAIAATKSAASKANIRLATTYGKLEDTEVSSQSIKKSNERIAQSVENMRSDANMLTASSARLTFENARLKRSSKKMRASLDELRQAKDSLEQRAAETQDVLRFAEEAYAIMEAIEHAQGNNKALNDLLNSGSDLAQSRNKKNQNSSE